MPKPNQRIAIQSKGRLREDSLSWLKSLGVKLPEISNRSLLVEATNLPLELMFVRHSDIPRYVQGGAATYGIVGANLLYEYKSAVNPIQHFTFGECKLVIAVPADSNIKTITDLSGHRIATSYPNSLRRFLRANNIAAAVIEMSGSVEIAPQLDLADAICDLTQSGNTLKAHNLVTIHAILTSTATLILPKNFTPLAGDYLYQKIQTQL